MLNHEQTEKLKELYGDDERAILESSASLDVLYAFGSLRESLLDWYEFAPGSLALLTSECPALERLLKRKGLRVLTGRTYGNAGSARNFRDAGNEESSGSRPEPDYLISVGDLDRITDEELSELYGSLKKGGIMIAACDNRYGIKYLNGVRPYGCAYSLKELFARLGGRQDGDELYYPMPDYRLPTAVYSESFLPGVGDLSRAVAAYDDAEFTAADLGSRYDEICRDGRFPEFANSFMVIRKKQ